MFWLQRRSHKASCTKPGPLPRVTSPYANPAQVGSLPVVVDGGPAGGGGFGVGLSELNVTARGNGTSPTAPYAGQGTGPNGEIVCVQDGPTTNPTGYHYLCLSANIGGNAVISYGTGGVATPGTLTFIINGVTVTPVACSGSPTSSFAAINGIVTHC